VTEIEIMRGQLPDADEIVAVFEASRNDALPYLPDLHSHEENRDWMRNRVFKECEVWVARQRSEIVGFMALKPGWIDHLYLRPGLYRRGIGTSFMKLAQSRQPGGLQLYAFQKNERARNFYEKHGFKAILFGDGSLNEEREPDVLYEWRGAKRSG
jgi:ribosomal protein S18 acetylase RimI-like enzyme